MENPPNLLPNDSTLTNSSLLPPLSIDNTLSNPTNTGISNSIGQELIFVDNTVSIADYQAFMQGRDTSEQVYMLNGSSDGLTQIEETLSGYQNVTAVHILSRSDNTDLLLGNVSLNNDNLPNHAEILQSWSDSLTPEADILLYNYDVTQNELGKSFAQQFADLTGADVGTSTNLGGQWQLEFSTGSIEAGNFTPPVVQDPVDVVNTYTVTNTADSGTGSLRDAITQANTSAEADLIVFDATVFATPQTITLTSGNLTLTDRAKTTITGLGADKITISGNNQSNIFLVFDGASAEISGLAIANGQAFNGAGIYNAGTLTLSNSILSSNTASRRNVKGNLASYGGAIFNSGTLTLNDNILNNNSGFFGGGISNTGTLTLSNNTLSNNSAFFGGGIFNDFGTVTANASTFTNNWAEHDGGGIYNDFGTVTLSNSTLNLNSSQHDGGGIYNEFGTLTIANSTLSDNLAYYNGGGIENFGSLTISQSTLSNNSAENGGGIRNYGGSAQITLTNSILANNSGGDLKQQAGATTTTTGVNLVADSSLTGANIINQDPLLGSLADNGGLTQTIELLAGSPAINAGDNSQVPSDLTTDQRGTGFNRISGSKVDLGAFEVQDDSPVIPDNIVVTFNEDSTYIFSPSTFSFSNNPGDTLPGDDSGDDLGDDTLPGDDSGDELGDDTLPGDDSGDDLGDDTLPGDDSGDDLGDDTLPGDDSGDDLGDDTLPGGDSGDDLGDDTLPGDDSGDDLGDDTLPGDDSGDDGTVEAIQIVSLPTVGSLTFNGNPVTVDTIVNAADLGNLKFTPEADANGDGYASLQFKIGDGTTFSTEVYDLTFNVTPANDAPIFTASDPPAIAVDSGWQTLTDWAMFNPGAPNESDQTATYIVSNISNPALFSILPSIDANGQLTYESAAGAEGTSTFDVVVQDSGGTTNGGVDTSPPQTFTITVNSTGGSPEINAPTALNVLSANSSISSISLSDDGVTATSSVSLQVNRGTLGVSAIADVTVQNNNTAAVTLAGSITNLNTALSSLTYNSGDFTGSDSLTITAGSNTAKVALTVARDVGTLGSFTLDITGSIDNDDSFDLYQFTLDRPGTFKPILGLLNANADMDILNSSGELIVSLTNPGTRAELISYLLAADTYYAKVYQVSGSTTYNLKLNTISS
ncbi:DUF4347 domain-containing protein [Aerosakkonemataceae cyanobacterium BLCC-F154]|uniref:DUF4347 domain-containing protein n=1 Tax=Floridaenema fluviatile BLCC-F154 TaxID=3153640 RepID=A0ABV4YBX3_9CYAN